MQLTGDTTDYRSIAWAIVKSTLFLVSMYFAGARLPPRIFALIASQGNRALFFLLTLGVAFGAGFLSQQ